MTAFVTPDVIGRLSLTAGKGLPVGAGNDGESQAGNDGFVTPDLIGRLSLPFFDKKPADAAAGIKGRLIRKISERRRTAF